MESPINIQTIRESLITVGNQQVLLDSDVAKIYGVATKRINEAVRNNPEKFPESYILKLTKEQLTHLRSKFSSAKYSKTRTLPKAFTEKGLYMLATILKSVRATQATLTIIETFAQLRELSSNLQSLTSMVDEQQESSLINRSSKILSNLILEDSYLCESESSIEVNLAILRLKHSMKRKKQSSNEGTTDH